MEICIMLGTVIFLFLYINKRQKADDLMEEILKARTQYQGIAEAVVQEVNKKRIMRDMVYYYPTFLYEVDGKSYGKSDLIFSTKASDFTALKKIRVRFDLNHPDLFMPVDDEGLYQMAKIEKSSCVSGIIVSCVLCVIAILFPNIFMRQ